MYSKSIGNLSSSIKNAHIETNNFVTYLEKNIFNLIFYPNIIEADIASDDYCKLIKSIKNYVNNLPSSYEYIIIREKVSEIPEIEEKEFKFYFSSASNWGLYIIFPLGITIWLNYYFKIKSLINKLRKVSGKLGTIDFFLKRV